MILKIRFLKKIGFLAKLLGNYTNYQFAAKVILPRNKLPTPND